jgi:two-component system, OmpR family, copper resistance phosphate regulon response regulator CusR
MRILIVEDQKNTQLLLKKGLTEAGFEVDGTGDGVSGLKLATTSDYDLIILDLMLPKMDGWSVLKELRSRGFKTSVLILTARDSVDDRVQGLDQGADDYLVKPFAFSELLARVRTLLRRHAADSLEIIKVSELSLNPLDLTAERSGRKLDLTHKEFMLLTQLARCPNEPVARTYLMKKVWNLNFEVETNIVDVAVSRLRSKVDDGFDKKLIHTLRGIGYVLRTD